MSLLLPVIRGESHQLEIGKIIAQSERVQNVYLGHQGQVPCCL